VVDGDLDAVELVPPDPVLVLDLVARLEAKKGAPAARRTRRTARIASNAEVEKALAKRLAAFAKRQRAMGGAGDRCQVRVPDTGSTGAGEAGEALGPLHPDASHRGPPPRPGEEQ
jgi:hypothetical protein